MRIIGLDPGLRNLGWGVVDYENGRLKHVDHGVIRTSEGALATRISALFTELSKIVDVLNPDLAAVEETFVNTNAASTLKLGHARAVCLLVPGLRGLPVAEYAPNTVKKALVGRGHADKQQIGHMVRVLLPGVAPSASDAADALALAICHAHHGPSASIQARVVQ